MSFTIGQKVVTTRAVGAMVAEGTTDIAEGTKGTLLGYEGDVCCVEVPERGRVYLAIDALKGARGRPRKIAVTE